MTEFCNFLVSGCSYTQFSMWPDAMLPGSKITNVSRSGAGNEVIANSVIYEIASGSVDPDFVFMLFSGINRIDLRLPKIKLLENDNTYYKKTIGNSEYYLNGGAPNIERGWLAGYNSIKDPSWPEISSLREFVKLPEHIKEECLLADIQLSTVSGRDIATPILNQYFVLQCLEDNNQKYLSERSFQHVMNACNFLDKKNIPYRFAFIYDIWATHHHYSLGQAVKEAYFNEINWDNFINFPPFEFGIKNDLLQEDDFHLTKEGMKQWGSYVRDNFLKKDKKLKEMF